MTFRAKSRLYSTVLNGLCLEDRIVAGSLFSTVGAAVSQTPTTSLVERGFYTKIRPVSCPNLVSEGETESGDVVFDSSTAPPTFSDRQPIEDPEQRPSLEEPNLTLTSIFASCLSEEVDARTLTSNKPSRPIPSLSQSLDYGRKQDSHVLPQAR
jgi:hypothetical protein